MSIAANLRRVKEEIAAACARAGRDPGAVALMAVSKMQPPEAFVEAYEAGQRLFGENRVQEWQTKSSLVGNLPGLNVHLIGPLQNNKTAKAAELFPAIDTIDAAKTAARLDAAAAASGKTLNLLIEVKLSSEPSKHGVAPEGLASLLAELMPLTHVRICGLMTVPPFAPDPETARPFFQQLRQLREEHQRVCATLTELSMGMSNDFRVAIEEGSTTVRLGTAIFGARG